MSDFAADFAVEMLTVSVRASVVLACVLAVHVLLGRWISARVRYLLWCVLFVRMLIPGEVAVPMMAAEREAVPESAHRAAPRKDTANPIYETGATASDRRAATTANLDGASDSRNAAGLAVASVWITGALFIAGLIVVGYHRNLGRALRSAQPCPEWVNEAFVAAKAEMRVAGWPVVLCTDAVASPTLVGAIRPKILLPSRLVESFSREELRLFLLHELAHMRAGDIWLSWVWCVALCAHWFNPLMWWAGGRIRRDRELACDERVLARVGESERSAYSHALLNALAPQPATRSPAYGLAGIVEPKEELERRIAMITEERRHGRFQWPAYAALALLIATVAFVQPATIAQEAREAAAIENPFSDESDESALSERRDEAAANGELIRAVQAEMQRVSVREQKGNPWKDKITLLSVYERMKSEGRAAADADEANAMIAELEAFAAAQSDDADYGWRIAQLCSAIAGGVEEHERATQYLEQAIDAYPHVKYSAPGGHSMFQHLVNRMAMRIWDERGLEAAEDYVVEMWQKDRRFAYFYDNPWRERLAAGNFGETTVEALQERLGERPALVPVTLTLTADGMRYDGRNVSWDEIERELVNIPNPGDHFVMLELDTTEVTVGTLAATQERCRVLSRTLGFDHFKDRSIEQLAGR